MQVSGSPERLALDMLQVAVRSLWRTQLVGAGHDRLLQLVQARSGLPRPTLEGLLERGLAAELAAPPSDWERRVFGAWYGPAAVAGLDTDQGLQIDLSGFAERHGVVESLHLMDALFSACLADGHASAEELWMLEQAGAGLGLDPRVLDALGRKHLGAAAAESTRVPLRGPSLTIGTDAACQVHLSDPRVSALHARLVQEPEGWRVVALGPRPVLLDGSPVGSAPVVEGSRIRVGRTVLRLAGDVLEVRAELQSGTLTLADVGRSVGAKTILDNVGFTVFAGEVVAVVGPSGCGKSSLLDAISGVSRPDQGQILLDGQPFSDLLATDPGWVGRVPQDDLVLPELTVAESLAAAARLRLCRGTSVAEAQQQVARVLAELDIAAISGSRIGHPLRRGISGGQRKRVNLGVELISPSARVLFLDEPTSGLDPRAAQDIAALARRLADHGRIVAMATHDLTPRMVAQVDLLLVLVEGGRMAFFGPPAEACAWFGVATPDAIFGRLGDHSPADWAQRFVGSPAHRRHVQARAALPQLCPPPARVGAPSAPMPGLLGQLSTLTARYARVKARDRTGNIVLLAQPVVFALIMWGVFGRPTTPMLFMLALSALWFGMFASVRELIVDRAVFARERRIGVRVGAYLGSKTVVLGAIVGAQCLALTGLCAAAIDLGGNGFALWKVAATSVVVGWSGVALGLLVSALWTSSVAAVGSLVLLLVPEITLSGLLVSLKGMPGPAQALSWLAVQRHAFAAMLQSGEKVDYFRYGAWKQASVEGELFTIGFAGADAGARGLGWESLIALVAAHGLLCWLGALGLLWRRP